jgi:hypothetical protein
LIYFIHHLPIPERLQLVHLPHHTLECNPFEDISAELCEMGFANQLFATLHRTMLAQWNSPNPVKCVVSK